jgi:hypothetical protein
VPSSRGERLPDPQQTYHTSFAACLALRSKNGGAEAQNATREGSYEHGSTGGQIGVRVK